MKVSCVEINKLDYIHLRLSDACVGEGVLLPLVKPQAFIKAFPPRPRGNYKERLHSYSLSSALTIYVFTVFSKLFGGNSLKNEKLYFPEGPLSTHHRDCVYILSVKLTTIRLMVLTHFVQLKRSRLGYVMDFVCSQAARK